METYSKQKTEDTMTGEVGGILLMIVGGCGGTVYGAQLSGKCTDPQVNQFLNHEP